MIIAEFNLWWLLIQEPGLTGKPVWYLIPGNICPPLNDGTVSSLHILETLMKFEIRKTQNRDTFYDQSAGSSVWFGSYSAATAGSSVFAFVLVE